MGSVKLALLNIKKNFRNEKELKSSFIISVVGMAINNIANIRIKTLLLKNDCLLVFSILLPLFIILLLLISLPLP